MIVQLMAVSIYVHGAGWRSRGEYPSRSEESRHGELETRADFARCARVVRLPE